MKKIIALILLVVYTTLTMGVSVSKHFCGNYLIDIQLFSSEKKTCKCSLSKGKATKKHDCCKDDIKLVKLEVKQTVGKELVFRFLKFTAFSFSIFFSNHIDYQSITKLSFSPQIAFPPPIEGLFLLFCVFRI